MTILRTTKTLIISLNYPASHRLLKSVHSMAVTITAVMLLSCSGADTSSNPIPEPEPNIAPTAAIDPNFNLAINGGTSINFIGARSFDPDANTPLIYDWRFPGGTPENSSAENPGDVFFNSVGTYQISLQVTDDLRLTSTPATMYVTVNDPSLSDDETPIAIISPSIAPSIKTGDGIDFSGNQSNDPDDEAPLSYDWKFPGGTPNSSTEENPGLIIYETAGTFMASLQVTDGSGKSSAVNEVAIIVEPLFKVISVIVLNDLHAHLTPHDDLKRNADGTSVVVKNRGGLARIATKINQIRGENPNNILMNIGDTFHGGVEAFFSLGNDIVAPVEALGIDVGVPGNWDFAYGTGVTRSRFGTPADFVSPPIPVKRLSYDNLAANVKISFGVNSGQTLTPKVTVTKNIAGINVGIIGITSDIVPQMSPLLATGMDFLQGEVNYIALIERLANQLRNVQIPAADVVVVMSELGIQKDKRLADRIAKGSVDVFFSAHTHELTRTPLTSSSGALVVEAGNDTYLGRMDISVHSITMAKSFSWSVIPIDSSIAENARIQRLVNAARETYLDTDINLDNPSPASSQTLTMPIDTVLATTSRLLSRRHSLESSFNNLITDLIRTADGSVNGTQLAVSVGFRFDSVIPGMRDRYEDGSIATGDITLEDIYRFFPVPYHLATAEVKGNTLLKIIETNLGRVYSNDIFQQSGGWIDGYSGLDITLDLSQPDNRRVISLSDSSGTPINSNTTLTVTGCIRPFEIDSMAFCTNGSGFTNIVPLINNRGTALTAVDFIVDALNNSAHTHLPARQNITDINATPQWPVSEFIQPLNGLP